MVAVQDLYSHFSTDRAQIGPLHDLVTWYGINYAGTQVEQWDLQNKEKSGWTGTSSFVLKVPLHYLHPSIVIINSVPCNQIMQRAYIKANPLCFQYSCAQGHSK